MKKLLSRKFLLAIFGAIVPLLNSTLEWGIDDATITKFVGILGTWIIGESVADAAGAKNAK